MTQNENYELNIGINTCFLDLLYFSYPTVH